MNTIIIAEAGVNHNGSIDIAKKLIDAASDAGADYVKFQTFKADNLVSKTAKKADYQIQNTRNKNESQYCMLKKLELNEHKHKLLIKHCQNRQIKFLSAPFDIESIDLLDKLNVNLYKIPSGEITNLPYLKKIAQKGKNIILSSGMSTLGEIKDAIKILCKYGLKKDMITILHCNTEYPTPMEDVNLRAMNTIADSLKIKVGYSDHTIGIEIPIAAVARGAVCIEKHFTLDRLMPGPDHLASLEPSELKLMIKSIRNIEQALGREIKTPSYSETKNINIARKSIHLNKDLNKGHIINEKDLIMLRPGDGISPMLINEVVGKRLIKNLKENSKLNLSDIHK